MMNELDIKKANNEPPTTQLEPLNITCIDCGNNFMMSPAEQKFYLIRGYHIPKRCPQCRKVKQTITTYTCKDCGKQFTLNNQELSFYKRQNLQIPKRCSDCRKIKKERNESK